MFDRFFLFMPVRTAQIHQLLFEEREALYSYASMEDLEQLKKDGIKQLESLRNYRGMEAHINNVDVDIGDIVGGRDRVTGMSIQQPVIGKILTVKNNEIDVEYKLKGVK